MFARFFATRSAAVTPKEPTMNLHTKLATTVALYVAAVALIVPLAAVSASTHPADAATTTATASQPTIIAKSQTCADQGNLTCADDVKDYWAKDAYNTYAAPIKDMPDASILQGFKETYVGSYTTQPNWGPNYVSIPSDTSPDVFHVFKVSSAVK
jgi:hypothetical protein